MTIAGAMEKAPLIYIMASGGCHFVIPVEAGIHDDDLVNSKQPCVYIMASKRNGTLYTGVTSNLLKRVWEHREGIGGGFAARYDVKRLVYFEAHGDMYAAITREKQIKEWQRRWKVELIEGMNPGWADLWGTIAGGPADGGPNADARNGFRLSPE